MSLDPYSPACLDELQQAIQAAAEDKTPLRIRGMDSKLGWAAAWRAHEHASDAPRHPLDMAAFNGIDLYEPEELVLRAGAATPIAEIQSRLRENAQHLAFEPPDIAPLHAAAPASAAPALAAAPPPGTLGGVIACNLSGPRRVGKGAARDSILGIEAVSGRGEVFRSGGRVMKNVTGYDLPKLLTGSYGTLAAMTRITLKILPAPETTATLLLPGLQPSAAVAAMTDALSSPYEVSAAAYLPAALTAIAPGTPPHSLTALRLEGASASLPPRLQQLQTRLAGHAAADLLPDAESRALWSCIADAACFAVPPHREAFLWRLFLPPARAHRLADLTARLDAAAYFLDWGGGLAWLAAPSPAPQQARALCQRVAAFAAEQQGHALLVRAPDASLCDFGGFASLGAAESALMERVRHAFDPARILSAL